MPDFDIDFCVEGRPAVKEYVIQKYGADRVTEIITFDFFKARGAIRDVGRVLHLPYAFCDQIAKKIDPRQTIAETLAAPDGKSLQQLLHTNADDKKAAGFGNKNRRCSSAYLHTCSRCDYLCDSAVRKWLPLTKE